MERPPFRFKQFSVFQSDAAHPVGTDSVLLGAWAPLEGARTVLDVGAGTGVVALMAAQRLQFQDSCSICALEPLPASFRQASDNVRLSPWAARIRVVQTRLQDFWPLPGDLFDAILCNPPYFPEATRPPDDARRQSRHSSALPPPVLVEHLLRLLAPQGRASVVLPPPQAGLLSELAACQGLYVTHRTDVRPRPDKPVERVMLCLERQAATFIRTHLCIYEEQEQYSAGFEALTRDFYTFFR